MSKNRRVVLIIAGSLFLLGWFRILLWPSQTKIIFNDKSTTTLNAVVSALPRINNNKQTLLLKSNDYEFSIFIPAYVIYWPGDVLKVSPGFYPQVEKITEIHNWKYDIWRAIFKFKLRADELIHQGLKEPEAGLAAALLLGDQRSLNLNYQDRFKQLGLTHIIAVSGSHISLLAMVLAVLFGYLGFPRKRAFYFLALFLFFYVTLTGLQASAIRSLIMGLLALLAPLCGRINQPLNSLIIAAGLMLFGDPTLPWSSPGFNLSFSAMLGIIFIYPRLDRLAEPYKKNKFARFILELLAMTLSAQIATAPLLLFYFHKIAWISPISNLLVLVALEILMILLLIATFLSFLCPPLAPFFFYPSHLLLTYILWITRLLTPNF